MIKSWTKRLIKSHFGHRCFSFLAAQYIRLVYRTNTWETIREHIPAGYIREGKPFLACFWHGRLGMLACAWKWEKPFVMLLSAHRDGQLIGNTVAYFGIQSIAGSTQRGGTQALRALVKAVKAGQTIGITPDGPRGPAQKATPGVVTIAKLAQVDIIPITFATSRRKHLRTWDRFHLALPFGKGVFAWGQPITVSSDADEIKLDQLRQQVEKEMNALQNEVDRLCGHAPLIPTS